MLPLGACSQFQNLKESILHLSVAFREQEWITERGTSCHRTMSHSWSRAMGPLEIDCTTWGWWTILAASAHWVRWRRRSIFSTSVRNITVFRDNLRERALVEGVVWPPPVDFWMRKECPRDFAAYVGRVLRLRADEELRAQPRLHNWTVIRIRLDYKL